MPGHRFVQARDHELDGPQPGQPGTTRSDADRRGADAADPHQDERLPERLRPAPHREHRLLRCVDQGRRAHGSRVHPARRRRVRRGRRALRSEAQGTAASQARPRSDRALGTLLRGRTRRRRAVQRVRRPRRSRRVRDSRQGPDDADRVQSGEHGALHRLDQERPVRGHPWRGRVRGLDSPAADAEQLEQASAQDVLKYGVEDFHPRLTMACSFQKEESVLVHMLSEIEPSARVFTIDTGVLFGETLTTWKAFEDRFDLKVDVIDARSPDEPWTADRCCGTAKVDALERALSDVDAWITGIRREQASTRAAAPKLERDEKRGIWTLNPIADWTAKDL